MPDLDLDWDDDLPKVLDDAKKPKLAAIPIPKLRKLPRRLEEIVPIPDVVFDEDKYFKSVIQGYDPYGSPLDIKKDELEQNIIRIDLEKAASDLAKRELGIKEGEDLEMYADYLQIYDKYYDILFKSKA